MLLIPSVDLNSNLHQQFRKFEFLPADAGFCFPRARESMRNWQNVVNFHTHTHKPPAVVKVSLNILKPDP